MSKVLLDHVAVLLNHALAAPVTNKLKLEKDPEALPEYYVELAFPPEAGEALHEVALVAANEKFGSLPSSAKISVHPNRTKAKPAPGIPADWLIVRAATRFAPALLDQDGSLVANVREVFYAGRRVRADLTGYGWIHPTGGKGVGFNLAGLLADADGDRLNLGADAVLNNLRKYAAGIATAPATATPDVHAREQATANPFAQKSKRTNNNPFAQKA